MSKLAKPNLEINNLSIDFGDQDRLYPGKLLVNVYVYKQQTS